MKWTEKEIRLARQNIPTKDLARMIGRTEAAVRKKRRALNIKINEAIYKPEPLSHEEKIFRLYKLARQIGVRIL